jgi:hypothetical protein
MGIERVSALHRLFERSQRLERIHLFRSEIAVVASANVEGQDD